LGPELIETLREVAGDDRLHFELVRELLDVEQRYRSQSRRAGLFESLEGAIRRNFYDDEDDALLRAQRRKAAMERSDDIEGEPDPLDIADGYVRRAAEEVAQ
jgi:DNA sulfur modification protein DndC